MSDTEDIPDDLITTPHAARLARVHIATIRRWIFARKIGAYRIGGLWMVSRAELLAKWQRVEAVVPEPPERIETGTERRRHERWVERELRRHGVG